MTANSIITKNLEKAQAQIRDLLDRIKEITVDLADLRKEFLATCKRNKDLESMADRLRSENELLRHELILIRNEHRDALVMLRARGVIIKVDKQG